MRTFGYHNSRYCIDCAQWRDKRRKYCEVCSQRLRIKARHRNRTNEVRI